MKTIYITETNGILRKQGYELILYKGREKIAEIKTEELSQIIIVGNIQISTQAMVFLFQKGIDVVFLSLSGKYRGRLSSEKSKNIELRKKQFKKFDEDEFIVRSSKGIVKAKLMNQLYFLRRVQMKRATGIVKRAIYRIKKLIPELERAGTVDSIRGYEGRGASIYFNIFGKSIIKEGFEFKNRSRRPPEDEINTLLSLGYTLLLNTVSGIVELSSLDKYFGVFHTPDYGKPSLVLDLMEEWRPIIIDALVVALINQGIIMKKDFYYPERDKPPFPELLEDFKNYPVILKRGGVRKIITYYEKRIREKIYYEELGRRVEYRNIMEYQLRKLIKAIEGDGYYEGFIRK